MFFVFFIEPDAKAMQSTRKYVVVVALIQPVSMRGVCSGRCLEAEEVVVRGCLGGGRGGAMTLGLRYSVQTN